MRGAILAITALLASAGALTWPSGSSARDAESDPSVGGMLVHDSRAYVPGQVVVRYRGQRDRTLRLPSRVAVDRAVQALERDPRVAYAAPNYIARASSLFVPRDSGHLRSVRRPIVDVADSLVPDSPPRPGEPGGWISRQWNFLPWQESARLPSSAGGINAVGGWQNLIRVGRPGARGVTVAVLDTGVAYRNAGRRFRRNPDFDPRRFARGYDFVLGNRWPLDRNGHGTHVAGTIAQQTDNGFGLTGLAYNARIMPVRVLDERGNGTSDRIAAAIRWATARGADVINMSFNFNCGDEVPNVAAAVRFAYRNGVALVGSAGNTRAEECVGPPASLRGVIGVGGITEGGCLGAYSPHGQEVDLVAPGGGMPVSGHGCELAGTRPIFQLTFRNRGDFRRFGLPSRYFGTSMAAAHVSGAAAMIRAVADAVGRDVGPRAVHQRLTQTARPPTAMPRLPGFAAGILDAEAATSPRPAVRVSRSR